MTDTRYGVEHLPNGYWCIFDRRSRLRGLFHANGKPLHGDLSRDMGRRQARALIAAATTQG